MSRWAIGNRSASIRMSEQVINTGEAAWTQVDAGCTVGVANTPDPFKIGAGSAEFVLAAAAAQGLQAYAATAATVDLTRAAHETHIKFWIRATVALVAGDLKIGLANAVDNSGDEYYVDVPAVAANTWTRCVVELSAPQLLLNDVDSVHLWLETAAWAGTVYIDDVRLTRYETSGTSTITLPETCTLNNTDADLINTDVFLLPWRSRLVTVYELDQDATLQYFLGGSPATWTSSDAECGKSYLEAGQTATDLERTATSIAVVLGADLGAADYLSIEVGE